MLNKFQLQNIAFLQPLNLGLVIKQNFCSDLELKVWSRFWNWCSGKIWSWSLSVFWCWCLVEVTKLGLTNSLSLSLVEKLMFGWDFEVNAESRFWNWNFEDLKNLWYELNPRVRCAFGNVLNYSPNYQYQNDKRWAAYPPWLNNGFLFSTEISAE